ncbi:hypothetical protein G6O67_007839 [Ophiocordyceps sinensis]|uniref:Uncharacterized protein n=2 Tax=Ophiocordyceps sinensis TaxID=72228 RepID=A0A8H4PJY9_9HYPO|nr:hypothetical protein OCS_01926 [Ophiocordyceps sinensis CO18]KAF4505942.1 hypothetical protein G6O67_007839 [Ophiocordyceps sinensis]
MAQDYILNSNGNIGAVIGIDINPLGEEATSHCGAQNIREDILEARICLSGQPMEHLRIKTNPDPVRAWNADAAITE